MAKTAVKSFTATLERLRINLGWVIAFVPFDVKKAWGKGGRPKVRGTINGFEFRSSLFPTREGRHFILVNKQMQEGAGLVPLRGGRAGMRGLQADLPYRFAGGKKWGGAAAVGAVVEFRIEPDFEERAVAIPAELKRLLDEDRMLRR
jgi:hypothetical protein